MKLEKSQTIMSASTTQEGDLVVSMNSGGFGRAVYFSSFRKTKSKAKGTIFYKSEKNECVSCVLSKIEDLILYVTDEEKIYKNSVKDLCRSFGTPFKGLTAKGNQLLNKDLLEGDDPSKASISYFTKLPSSDLEELMPDEDFEEESEEKPEAIVE